MELIAKHIEINGLVQGVGFRPFIYRQAINSGLKGWTRNYNGGVELVIEGTTDGYNDFISAITSKSLPVASVSGLKIRDIKVTNFSYFEIRPSHNNSQNITNISPDIAVCDACLEDLRVQPRRLGYPFTNCSHCGSRFSIIKKIPYDRSDTTMDSFEICSECEKEYKDISDRRFHAQTISCWHCGPSYKWISDGHEELHFGKIIHNISSCISERKVIAIKGTGGFNLICDAHDRDSVKRIREIKRRYSKPFAIMFRDLSAVRKYAYVSAIEETLIKSRRRPVVILKAFDSPSEEVNRGFSTLGAILPYTPFHYLLMKGIETDAILFTSANLKGRPLISDNQEAIRFFDDNNCDAVVYHNRNIQNRQDDSVVMVNAGKNLVLRRARGYVPEPVYLGIRVEGILAMGADLKNSFCIGKGKRAIMSQYTGDLEDFDIFSHYKRTINTFQNLFDFLPEYIAIDSHPDFHSSSLGRKLTKESSYPGRPEAISVQHHHAHIASVLAEHQLDEKVIGVAMDGTGYGDDGKIRGSEFLECDLENYRRHFHLACLPLPGGEKAVREPWRMAVAALYKTFDEKYLKLSLRFNELIGFERQKNIINALNKNINIYESCGMGRLFDVIAALLNIVHINHFDGEGPVKLENICSPVRDSYPLLFIDNEYSYEPVVREVVNDLLEGIPIDIISGRFHNTIVKMICDGVKRIANSTGLNKVALSGGIFQNRIITGGVKSNLVREGFDILTNMQVPCNDGGIALGQIAVAAKKLQLCV